MGGMSDMYVSATIAIPVDNPQEVALWYKEYLGLSDIKVIDDVYEVEIMNNLWIQFYNNSEKKEFVPVILRFGVDDLDNIVNELEQKGQKVKRGKEMEGIRYLYSQQNQWGQRVGFYELDKEGEL